MKPLARLACDRDGSFAPIAVLALIPLMLGVGVAVDFTSATNTEASMQNALDAAILANTLLPKNAGMGKREEALQEAYEANGGSGDADVDNVEFSASGAISIEASAAYEMPTSFMGLAHINTVPVSVEAAVTKQPRLLEATFKVVKVSGWWNKTMTLYGVRVGEKSPEKLMQIDYAYNGAGDPKGYGTSTTYTVTTDKQGKEKLKHVQQQICHTKTVADFDNLPADAITGTSGSKKYVTTCVTAPSNDGAVIDVSEMDSLYLQMDVPSGKPSVLRTNDPATSDHLYLEGDEVEKGKVVDIFTAVGCGKKSNQAWEDGGSPVPAPVVNADFFYWVTGKCGFSDIASPTVLTD